MKKITENGQRSDWKRDWQLWIMILPALAYVLVFCYGPMYGLQLAFRDFDFRKGMTGGEWAGLKCFKQYFDSPILAHPA